MTNEITLSPYGQFAMKWQGYEFYRNGKAIQKCAVWCNIQQGRNPENNGINVRQKPGWSGGVCRDLAAYETYLKNVKF